VPQPQAKENIMFFILLFFFLFPVFPYQINLLQISCHLFQKVFPNKGEIIKLIDLEAMPVTFWKKLCPRKIAYQIIVFCSKQKKAYNHISTNNIKK